MSSFIPLALLAGVCAGAALGEDARAADAAPSAAERRAMEKVVSRCFGALPGPTRPFRRDHQSDFAEIAARSAEATRVYERRPAAGTDEDPMVLEIRVYVNRERSLPEPLGSEGGALQTFRHDGIPTTRVFLAGVGVDQGRVALPLSPQDEADALTVVRLHVGPPYAEKYLEEIAQGRRPDRTPWDGAAPLRGASVRTLVVEFRGPRAEVELLLRHTLVPKLRAILDPS